MPLAVLGVLSACVRCHDPQFVSAHAPACSSCLSFASVSSAYLVCCCFSSWGFLGCLDWAPSGPTGRTGSPWGALTQKIQEIADKTCMPTNQVNRGRVRGTTTAERHAYAIQVWLPSSPPVGGHQPIRSGSLRLARSTVWIVLLDSSGVLVGPIHMMDPEWNLNLWGSAPCYR